MADLTPDEQREWQLIMAGVPQGAPSPIAPEGYTGPGPSNAPPVGGQAGTAASGMLQGASRGWSDELAAGIDLGASKVIAKVPQGVRDVLARGAQLSPGLTLLQQALSDPSLKDPTLTYEQRRDRYREKYANQLANYPLTYRGGELAGNIATRINPGSAVGTIAAGAAEGAVTGAGYSEASTAKELARDAGLGSAIGTAAAIPGTVRAARAAERTFQDIGRGQPLPLKSRLEKFGADDVHEEMRKFGINTAKDARPALAAAKQSVGTELAADYKAIDGPTGGVTLSAVDNHLDQLEQRLRERLATKPMADDVAKLRQGLQAQYGAASGGRVPSRALKDEITALNEVGFAGNNLSPTASKKLSRWSAGAMQNALDDHLDEAGRTGPGAAATVRRIAENNRSFSILATVDKALGAKAIKDRFSPTILEQALEKPGTAAKRIVSKGVAAVPALTSSTSRVLTDWLVNGGDRKQAQRQLAGEIFGGGQ